MKLIGKAPARSLIVALGANLSHRGDSALETLKKALKSLAKHGFFIEKTSGFWRTPCFPVGAGPDYVNAAVQVGVPQDLSAAEVLAVLHKVEGEFARQREARWAGRTLDLDLIADGDAVAPDLAGFAVWREMPLADQMQAAPRELILPHPRLQDRGFVLVPMAEIAPDWRHPVLGVTVVEMLAARPQAELSEIVKIEADPGAV